MSDTSVAAPTAHNLTLTDDGYVHTGVGKPKLRIANRYYIDDQTIARAFSTVLDPVLTDLADIALAIYVADRLCRRKKENPDHYNLNWTRQISISLPLRDPERWQDQLITSRLSELLWLLTEDEWSFHFRARRGEGRPSETANFLFSMPPQPPVTTALFSGGLDSFVGVSEELDRRPQGSLVLFSAITNSRLGSRQRELVQDIRRLRGDNIIHVAVPLGLRQRDRMGGTDEPTQRSRGFVFQMLGAVTALMASAKELYVYENGVGAISLPYTAAQVGAHNTRATSPIFLTEMSEFVSTVVGHRFEIRNPYLFRTKGQLCEALRHSQLRDLIGRTGSCDGFPLLRRPNKDHCGYCTSCLLRRQALLAAGLEVAEPAARYLHDLTAPLPTAIDSHRHRKHQERLWPWQAMDHQVALLQRALAKPEPWSALSRAYPQLFEIAEVLESLGEPTLLVQSELVNLYRRYCEEWQSFSQRVPVRLSLRMN